MAFQINSNLSAVDAYNALLQTTNDTQAAQLQLASQKRINSVGDDTSGYRVGKELSAKVSLMKSAMSNVSSAKSILSTAESALSSINDLLIQIKGKISAATDPTKNQTSLANDIKALGDEISAIFSNTKFNDTALLSGSTLPSSGNFVFKTGESENTTVNYGTLNTLDLSSITSTGTGAVDGTSTHAITSLSVDSLQTAVQDALGKIGNFTQRLDVKEQYLTAAVTNAQSTVDGIFGADIAQQQLIAAKGNIAQQISTTMLAQLNAQPQQLLRLFQ